MQIDTMKIEVVGITPLLLHNGRTANPLDPYAKALKGLTSKRQKTEDDVQALLLLQWESGLYYSEKLGLYMPSENLFAAFYKGAKKHKLGTKMSGLSFPHPMGYSIVAENCKNFEAMKADPSNKFVKTVSVQKSKTISCRPIFEPWSLAFDVEFDTTLVDASEIKTILETMSTRIGFGVWTPGSPKPGSFGKFEIAKMEWTNSKTKEVKKLI